jgi:hypothetical protein
VLAQVAAIGAGRDHHIHRPLRLQGSHAGHGFFKPDVQHLDGGTVGEFRGQGPQHLVDAAKADGHNAWRRLELGLARGKGSVSMLWHCACVS